MDLDFDVRTAYFLLGVLSVGGSLGVHATLRLRRRRRHQTWVAAGLCFGGALVMVAFRGWVPEMVTYELSHLLFVSAFLLHISALCAEVGRGWPASRMVATVATTGLIYGVFTTLDRGWGLMFNVVILMVGSSMIVASAWRVWRQTRLLPALVIAAGFGFLLAGLTGRILSLLQTTFGRGGPFEPSATQITLMMGGLFACILGHLGNLGLQFLHMQAERVASERTAAMEAERSRQVREREAALRDLLEERNQFIQRIARSEAASNLALFATALPHELSQPLCAAKLSLDSLRHALERGGDASLLPVVRSIETSTDRVLDLLQQLRILLQAQEHTDHQTQDLRALVLRTLPILEGSFRENRIRLRPLLPEREFQVRASATQVQQLLLILCAHALDDLRRQPPPEGREPVVQVSLEGDAQTVRLRVEDSGAPAPAAALRPLTTAVAGTGTGAGAGTDGEAYAGDAGTSLRLDRLGVGLTVAQRVAQSHRGSLDIEESMLGGNAFVFTLPTADVAHAVKGTWGLSAAQAPATAAAASASMPSAAAMTPPPRQTSPS